MIGATGPSPSAGSSSTDQSPASGATDGSRGSNTSTEKAKRGGIACTVCRMKRAKCVHTGAVPCVGCIASGKEAHCVFPGKGTSVQDRAPRGLRKRVPKKNDAGVSTPVATGSTLHAAMPVSSAITSAIPARLSLRPDPTAKGKERETDDDADMPPPSEVLEGVRNFFDGYFQLAFLHRPTFVDNLERNPKSVSKFLLLAVLSVSARWTASLIERYGGRMKASNHFFDKAQAMMFSEMVAPSLERVQAFYILGVSDWGSGHGFRSLMLQGVAGKMAETMRLGRDDEGDPPPRRHPNGSGEPVAMSAIEIEVRRRTWWFLLLNTSLLSAGYGSSQPYLDPVKALTPLPATEQDFAFGVASTAPMYFPGSPLSPTSQGRHMSLTAAMLTLAVVWGRLARVLCGPEQEHVLERRKAPWDPTSFFKTTISDLGTWVASLSNQQRWSNNNLLAYRSVNLDLGFYALYVNFHIGHVGARRHFLPLLIKTLHPSAAVATVDGQAPPGGREYWAQMAAAMVQHSFDLIEVQDRGLEVRPLSGGCTPLLAFGRYLAGSVLNYLRLCPWLHPALAPRAASAISASLEVLGEMAEVWPMAARWFHALSTQSNMSPPDSAYGDRAATEAAQEIAQDQRVGFYRQYDEHEPALPASQMQSAASTLAQLSVSSAGTSDAGSDHAAPSATTTVLDTAPTHEAPATIRHQPFSTLQGQHTMLVAPSQPSSFPAQTLLGAGSSLSGPGHYPPAANTSYHISPGAPTDRPHSDFPFMLEDLPVGPDGLPASSEIEYFNNLSQFDLELASFLRGGEVLDGSNLTYGTADMLDEPAMGWFGGGMN